MNVNATSTMSTESAQYAALPCVLLHGWGFTPQVWQPLLDELGGANTSGTETREILTPPLPLTGTLEQDMDELAATLPPQVHLTGWSLGGEVALAYAQRFPDRVASLTLISSTPCFTQQPGWSCGQPFSLLDDFAQRLADNPAALLKRFGMLIRHGDADAAKNRTLAETLQRMAETAQVRLEHGLTLLRSIDLRTTQPVRLPMPVQLIHGEADAVVPLAAAISVAATQHALCHTLPAASHALPLTHATLLSEHLWTFWCNPA